MNHNHPSQQAQGRLSGRSLRIVNVQKRRERRAFIRLPWSLYQDDPMWVPPLLIERHQHLSPKNPFFEHADCAFWIACRDGKPVGRISAQIDRLSLARYHDDTGFWGMLEAEDNIETFQALFNTAETWLRQRGMRRAAGPFNLSINQECGLLVSGFDTPPSVMMGHARPYYGKTTVQCGYRQVKDLLAYIIDNRRVRPAATKIMNRSANGRVRTRALRWNQYREDLAIVQNIYNDAWSQNWRFVPFTPKEFEHVGNDLKLLLKDELVSITEVDGEPAAFMVVLPNLNEVIRDMNGRLLPFNWLKMLWRLKIKYPGTARIPLMGVRRRYHDTLLGARLAYAVIGNVLEAVERNGIRYVEMSWILEDNLGMRNIIENIGGRAYKTYRIYGKDL